MGIFCDVTFHNLTRQLIRGLAGPIGHLGEPRFLLDAELHFHDLTVRAPLTGVNLVDSRRSPISEAWGARLPARISRRPYGTGVDLGGAYRGLRPPRGVGPLRQAQGRL